MPPRAKQTRIAVGLDISSVTDAMNPTLPESSSIHVPKSLSAGERVFHTRDLMRQIMSFMPKRQVHAIMRTCWEGLYAGAENNCHEIGFDKVHRLVCEGTVSAGLCLHNLGLL
jgi:hypothetical protein